MHEINFLIQVVDGSHRVVCMGPSATARPDIILGLPLQTMDIGKLKLAVSQSWARFKSHQLALLTFVS